MTLVKKNKINSQSCPEAYIQSGNKKDTQFDISKRKKVLLVTFGSYMILLSPPGSLGALSI